MGTMQQLTVVIETVDIQYTRNNLIVVDAVSDDRAHRLNINTEYLY